MTNQIPALDSYLPELFGFIQRLASEHQRGFITEWEEMNSRVLSFFTPEFNQKLERSLPGWKNMASYANGQTVVHTVCVMVSIFATPQYQQANQEQKQILEWSALLHDISKRVVMKGKSDHTHAYRSAADAANILILAGSLKVDPYLFRKWEELTKNASITKHGVEIQDNAQLHQIILGLDTIFGESSASAKIIKTILLHWSFDTLAEWPSINPLTENEMKQFLKGDLLEILGCLILADSNSWNLFDEKTKRRYQEEILESISKIRITLQTP